MPENQNEPILLQLNPVIPVADMDSTIRFYTEKMGFMNVFDSSSYEQGPINYAVLCRKNVCFHFQLFDSIDNITMPQIRIQVQNLDDLFLEYKKRSLIDQKEEIRTPPWGTREFAFFDPNRVSLTFFEAM